MWNQRSFVFNFAHKYNYNFKNVAETCNMYGKEANLYMANIPDENNKFNTWNFRYINISNDDFLSLDKNELAGERGEDGKLPEINFMKLNPNGPNYEILKSIEDEMKNYEILEDGTIRLINSNSDSSEEEPESPQNNENKDQNGNSINNKVNTENNNNNYEYNSNNDEETNDNDQNNSTKLSIGAIIGIVLGIVISILIIIFIIYILRKKKKLMNEVITENKVIKFEESKIGSKINKDIIEKSAKNENPENIENSNAENTEKVFEIRKKHQIKNYSTFASNRQNLENNL